MSPSARFALLALAAPLAYSMVEPWRIAVRRFAVPLPDLPAEAEGLTIAQLSDLHCSALTPASLVRRAVALCNREQPDLIVLTGDYVSRRNSYPRVTLARRWARPVMEYAAEVTTELAALRAPEGVFAVPGNHDHSGRRFDAIEELLNRAGIVTLVNRAVRVRGVLPLAGLDDLRGGRPRLRPAFSDVPAEAAQVILTHNPRLVPLLAGRNALVLCGHTHGGQVHLPLTDFRRRPNDMHGSAWHQGWYRQGAARVYVSVGIGSVHFPMRFGCPPEMAVFTLRRSPA